MALERAPDDEGALRGRADALVSTGRAAEAATTLDRLAGVARDGRPPGRCLRRRPARPRAGRVARPAAARAVARRPPAREPGRSERRRGARAGAERPRGRRGPDVGHDGSRRPAPTTRCRPGAAAAEPEARAGRLAPPPDPLALSLAFEAAFDAGKLDEARKAGRRQRLRLPSARAVPRRDRRLLRGARHRAGRPGVHFALAQLYLDRGWRSLAADKLVLLGRLAQLTGDTASAGPAVRPGRATVPGRPAARRHLRLGDTAGARGPAPRGAMLHSDDDAGAPRIDPRSGSPDDDRRHRDHGAPDLLAVQPDPRDPRRPPRDRRQRPVRGLRRWRVAFDLRLLTQILQAGAVVGLFALVVDLPAGAAPRARADRAGRLVRLAAVAGRDRAPPSSSPTEVARAAAELSAEGHGALIVLERETGLEEIAETGVMIHGDVSADLLRTIFSPRSPLHDGAVIIRGDRILAAGALLPLAETIDPLRAVRDPPPGGARHHRADRRGRRRRVRGERPDQPRRAGADRAQPERGRPRPRDPGFLDPTGGRRGAFGGRAAERRAATMGTRRLQTLDAWSGVPSSFGRARPGPRGRHGRRIGRRRAEP